MTWTSVAISLRSRFAGEETFLVLSQLGISTRKSLNFNPRSTAIEVGEVYGTSEGASMKRPSGDGDNEILPMVGQRARLHGFWDAGKQG